MNGTIEPEELFGEAMRVRPTHPRRLHPKPAARKKGRAAEGRADGMKRLTPSSTWWHTVPH